MNSITFGIICGAVFGVVDVLIMIPLKYENQRKKIEAMTAAFIERFMIGFLIPNVQFGISPILSGFILGLALSLPSAIITRVYIPIIGVGAAGGIIIGIVEKAILP